MSIFCVVGIDTGIGKTEAVGHMAKSLMGNGQKVITFKMVQTGCTGVSEDILRHREIMGIHPLREDWEGKSCPYVFPFPGSPHLAGEMAGKSVDPQVLNHRLAQLQKTFDVVIVEGSGGLMVPLTRELLLVDYLHREGLPVYLVSSPRLGSVNHTLLSVEALKNRGIPLKGIIYNLFGDHPGEIVDETRRYLKTRFPEISFFNLGEKGFLEIFEAN